MRVQGPGPIHCDRGVSLVEFAVSMLLASILAVGMVTWIASSSRSVLLHTDDDSAVQDLRVARERMGRELRRAGSLLSFDGTTVTVWLDDNADSVVDMGERVTWSVTPDGTLVRSTDAGDSTQVVSGLVVSASGFAFDALAVGDVSLIEVTLVASVGGSDRTMKTEIHLRNT